MPTECPATFYWAGKQDGVVRVSYTIRACLDPMGEDKQDTMQHTENIIVHQIDPKFDAQLMKDQKKLKKCGCMGKGRASLTTKIEKGIATADSTIRTVADIDASEAQVASKTILVSLKQEINMEIDGQKYNMTSIIAKQKFGGVQKGEKTDGMNKFLDLELKAKKAKVPKAFKNLPPEEKFLASQVPPCIIGNHVNVRYEVIVEGNFGGTKLRTVNPVFLHPGELKRPEYEKPNKWSPQTNPGIKVQVKIADPATESPSGTSTAKPSGSATERKLNESQEPMLKADKGKKDKKGNKA